MAKQKQASLAVETDGKRHYIRVPVGRASELHDYLRANKVRSAPPEPAFTGVDNIELSPGSDVGDVQVLLNKFSAARLSHAGEHS